MKTSRKFLLSAVASAFALATVTTPAFAGNYGTNSTSADPASEAAIPGIANQTVTVNVNVGSIIGLDCEDSVTIPAIVGYGDKQADVACSVVTNNTNGYKVDVTSMTSLVLAGETEVSAAANQKFTAVPANMSNAAVGAWALSIDNGTTWVGAGTTIKTQATPSLATGDNFDVTVGAHAGSTAYMQNGGYAGNFVLTATAL